MQNFVVYLVRGKRQLPHLLVVYGSSSNIHKSLQIPKYLSRKIWQIGWRGRLQQCPSSVTVETHAVRGGAAGVRHLIGQSTQHNSNITPETETSTEKEKRGQTDNLWQHYS